MANEQQLLSRRTFIKNGSLSGFALALGTPIVFANLFPEATIAVIVSGVDPNTLPTTFYNISN